MFSSNDTITEKITEQNKNVTNQDNYHVTVFIHQLYRSVFKSRHTANKQTVYDEVVIFHVKVNKLPYSRGFDFDHT